MNVKEFSSDFRSLYYRLIALWVICEGVAGGIMHGLKIPFSGMIISGSAVVCISLIAYFIPIKGAVLRATFIVLIFKMMLSPHTPPTAYLAVLFQGAMGQLLFYIFRSELIAPILLGILALVESAIQRVLVFVILYGNDFWNAVNDFIKKLLDVSVVTNYTLWLAVGYVFIHAVAGFFVGIMVHSIIKKSKNNELLPSSFIIERGENALSLLGKRKNKKRKRRWGLLFLWLILLVLFLQSTFEIGSPILPSNKALMIFIRSLLIIFLWYFIISPSLIRWIKKRLELRKEKSRGMIQSVSLLLPSTEYLFLKSWEFSSQKKGMARLLLFWKIVLGNVLLMDVKPVKN